MFNRAAKKSKLLAKQARQFSSTSRNNSLHRPVIVSAVRTPIASFNGKFSGFEAPKLGALAVRGAVEQAGITKADVQEVILGNVVSSNLGQAPARQAAIHAGLNQSTICTTVNKMCASGMKSVMYAAQSIMLGHSNCVVAGGFESMTNAPYLLPKVRQGLRYGDAEVIDSLKRDGLTDAYDGSAMGVCADKTAKDYSLSREEVDKYAIESYNRAAAATAAGYFKNEIIGVAIPDKKGTVYMNEDEEYKNIKFDKIPTLKPAFGKDGVSTAANSSKLSDGAAALVVMSEEKAQRAGLKPIARILGFADAEKAPIEFTTAPADAIPKAIKLAGLNQSDIDYYEINEAFAVVALANMKILGLDPTRVNIFGGAVALGHPIGASGARIIATLINVLKVKDAKLGVAAICNGGGGASSIVIERLQ